MKNAADSSGEKPSANVWKFVKTFALFAFWAAAVWFIYANYLHESALPPRPTPPANETPDTIRLTLIVLVVELIVLFLILRPWSYRRSYARALGALILFVPWTFFWMIILMHAPSSFFLHWIWLLLLNLVLIFCAIVSGIAAIIFARRNKLT